MKGRSVEYVAELILEKLSALIGPLGLLRVEPVTATPIIYNVTLTLADTEYSQAMPLNCRCIEFQARTAADIRFAFVTGKVATPTAPYMTLKSGHWYFSQPLSQGAAPSTLYLGTATAGTVVEILAWT